MGSLCCVAARPHGTSSTSREWPLTPTDPFWRTNASFSLAPSDQFYRYHSFPSHGSRSSIDGISLNYASSDSLDSSNSSHGSMSWARSGTVNVDSGFEGALSNFSSPDNGSENWDEQEVNVEGFLRVPAPRPSVFTSDFEENSLLGNSGSSTTSQSDHSTAKYELIVKSPLFTARGPSTTRRSFITTPVHPLSFPDDSLSLSSPTSSVVNPTEAPEPSEKLPLRPRCGICKRLLSKKSPWCSRKIVRSSDMPVVSILSCSHAYHAECLDRAATKPFRHDPACPVCDKSEKDDGNTEQWAICRLKNGFPRLRSVGEGPSRVWSCAGVDDMGTFDKDRLKRHLSQKESSRDSECCTSPVLLEGKLERSLILS